ncbi:hypothetical protein CSC94_05825 [Zhengella mangrovi]|uniref:Uncharacterized protein n=1 Tax=Zhengella mangrovi TaxID=1982044 RepID=A0A2G1QSI5_9HYPH|nr:hypothetical protein [Zhengella mangrovi]PHP68168.1 hypothetical protein CSC94_05825 [Zhengella mangrovi]
MKHENIWRWTRFVVGVLMFAALMAIHVLVKELHIVILSAPFGLMGFDAPDLLRQFTGQGGKK